MMTKFKTSNNAILRKIALITLFFPLGMSLTFSQENILNKNISKIENGWWYPIIQKHKIDLKQYNYRNSFTMVKPDTIYNESWFELGKSDSLNNRNIPFKDAILISKSNSNHYCIIKSTLAHHDFNEDIIVMEKSTIEFFSSDYKDTIPMLSDSSTTLRINIKKFTISK
jgi:hypothetical protein